MAEQTPVRVMSEYAPGEKETPATSGAFSNPLHEPNVKGDIAISPNLLVSNGGNHWYGEHVRVVDQNGNVLRKGLKVHDTSYWKPGLPTKNSIELADDHDLDHGHLEHDPEYPDEKPSDTAHPEFGKVGAEELGRSEFRPAAAPSGAIHEGPAKPPSGAVHEGPAQPTEEEPSPPSPVPEVHVPSPFEPSATTPETSEPAPQTSANPAPTGAVAAQPLTQDQISDAEEQATKNEDLQAQLAKTKSDAKKQALIYAAQQAAVGNAHSVALDPSDLRVGLRVNPDTGSLRTVGQYFVDNDPYHQRLLRGQAPEDLEKLPVISQGIARGEPFHFTYTSAEPEYEEEPPTQESRQFEYQKSTAQQRIAAKQGTLGKEEEEPPSIDQHVSMIPMQLATTKDTPDVPPDVMLEGFGHQQVMNNTGHIWRGARQAGVQVPYSGPEDPNLIRDVMGYMHNQKNGFRGDGSQMLDENGQPHPLWRENQSRSMPYVPHMLDRPRAEFIHMAMNIKPSAKPKPPTMPPGFGERAKWQRRVNEGYSGELAGPNRLWEELDRKLPQVRRRKWKWNGKTHEWEVHYAKTPVPWSEGTLERTWRKYHVKLMSELGMPGIGTESIRETGAPAHVAIPHAPHFKQTAAQYEPHRATPLSQDPEIGGPLGEHELPAEPGSTPIPPGHVRLYHQTSEDNLDEIAKHGLSIAHARGIEGPRAIYADEQGFYGDPRNHPSVEFHVPRENWSPPFVMSDKYRPAESVPPENIIALHRPWHRHARYAEEHPEVIRDILSGVHDDLDNDSRYGPAHRFIKAKYAPISDNPEVGAPTGGESEGGEPGLLDVAESEANEEPTTAQPQEPIDWREAVKRRADPLEEDNAERKLMEGLPTHYADTGEPIQRKPIKITGVPLVEPPEPVIGLAGGGMDFGSPSIREGMNLRKSKLAMSKGKPGQVHQGYRDFNSRLEDAATARFGGHRASMRDAYGAWKDGAENSLRFIYGNQSRQDRKIMGAIRGLHSAQKQVLNFHYDDNGPHRIYHLSFNSDKPEEIDELLDKHGIQYRTLEAPGKGQRVWAHIVDASDRGTDRNTEKAIEKLIKGGHVYEPYVRTGHADFIGDENANSREEGAREFRRVLEEARHQAAQRWTERGGDASGQPPPEEWWEPFAREAEANFEKLRQSDLYEEQAKAIDKKEAALDRDKMPQALRQGRADTIQKGKDFVAAEQELPDLGTHKYIYKHETYPEGVRDNEDKAEHFNSRNQRLDYNNPEHRSIAAKALTSDIMHALANGSTAYGWYDHVVKKAMKKFAELAPELKTNKQASQAFKLAMAITSQGQDVYDNAESAWHAYQYWRKHGHFPTDAELFGEGYIGGGIKHTAMIENFSKLNQWVDEMGWNKVSKMLHTPYKVGQMQKLFGRKVAGEAADEDLPGSAMLGPKVGIFFQNLFGNYDPVTMDLWFSRTMNRMAGNMFGFSPDALRKDKGEKQKAQLTRLTQLLDSGTMQHATPEEQAAMRAEIQALHDAGTSLTDRKQAMALAPTITDWADRTHRFYNKSEGLEGSYNKALQNPETSTAKNIDLNFHGLSDDPRGPEERKAWRKVMKEVDANLKANGVHITNADKQALLWYLEQQMFQGEEASSSADYLDAAYTLARKVRNNQLKKPIQ